MCGIFGEFCPTGGLTHQSEFGALLALSRNRGPDADHVYRDSSCALGFNRLAILELSDHAMQPISSPTATRILVFNGEIYNFKQLAKKYGIDDQPCCLTSDTVVLSHLTDLLTPDRLAEELDGMFAIALYDRKQQSLSLIRDFAGIKPLFYSVTGDRVIFASQYNQVFHHPATRKRELNPSGIRDYLQLGYMPGAETILAGIQQLEPGKLITFDHDLHPRQRAYFRFSAEQISMGPLESSEEAGDALRDALATACQRTLVSDVPLGCFVSGGIDSPLIAALARDVSPDLHGYTAGVDDAALNEAEIARAYCDALQMRQTVLDLTPEHILAQKESHFEALTDPVADYSSLASFAITHEARRHVTVMLSGDGGDELFWGYPRFYKFVREARILGLPGPLRRATFRAMRAVGRKISHGVSVGLGSWVMDTQSQILSSDLDRLFPGGEQNSEWVKSLYEYGGDYSPADVAHWLRFNEFYGHLQRVLAKVDRTSMGNSLEVRIPFLCKDVVRAAWNMRFDQNNTEPKLLLKRELAARMPTVELNTRKMGFTVPINVWLRTFFKEEVREFAHHPVLGESLIEPRVLQQFTERFFRGEHDYGWAMWILYSLQKWAALHLQRPALVRA